VHVVAAAAAVKVICARNTDAWIQKWGCLGCGVSLRVCDDEVHLFRAVTNTTVCSTQNKCPSFWHATITPLPDIPALQTAAAARRPAKTLPRRPRRRRVACPLLLLLQQHHHYSRARATAAVGQWRPLASSYPSAAVL
jgi:hypothetical protein